jgi:predicted amidohydrolase
MAGTNTKKREVISISLVQPDLVWEDREANLENLTGMLEGIPGRTDLILLPETFSTGFTMRADLFAEGADGVTVGWMQTMAREKQARIAGSLIIREQGQIFNRLFWVSPDGVEGSYDKRHLFRLGREDQFFRQGESRRIFSLGPFRFMPQICYDLRFPVFARNRNDYDVLLYVANWPAPRQMVWETLLRARAIENQAFVLGVNRTGVDGEGVQHEGGTCAIDPLGRMLQSLDGDPGVLQVSVDLNQIREFRAKFPVWKDADHFSLG